MIISKEYTESLKDFMKCVIDEINDLMIEDRDALLSDKDYGETITNELTFAVKAYYTIVEDEDYELADDDKEMLSLIIGFYIFEIIRHDDGVDNADWLYNIMAVWKIIQK